MLISVDGMHQSDLQWYVANHPGSALAQLFNSGTEYSNAQTPIPSDSFPGMVAQLTGATRRALASTTTPPTTTTSSRPVRPRAPG